MAMPALPSAASTPASPAATPPMFERIDFVSDGLGLDPREYASVLGTVVATQGFAPDGYSRGGVVATLEARFAALLGKEAAIFMPTGTLANAIAVRTLAGDDRRVLVQAESHVYNDSGDVASTLAGLNLVPLGAGAATMSLAEVSAWLERSGGGRVETRVGAISIENPVRRLRHAMVDLDELDRVCAHARARGIRLHLDGARMFNLPLHCGRSVRELAAPFDTVYVSLWKHFNAGSGAILAGDASVLEGLHHVRRMFGGALPSAWPEAAPALQYVDRYEADYAAAWAAADRVIALLQRDRRFSIRRIPGGTSQFVLATRGIQPDVLVARAAEQGIVLPRPWRDGTDVTLQVNATVLRRPAEAIAGALLEAAGA